MTEGMGGQPPGTPPLAASRSPSSFGSLGEGASRLRSDPFASVRSAESVSPSRTPAGPSGAPRGEKGNSSVRPAVCAGPRPQHAPCRNAGRPISSERESFADALRHRRRAVLNHALRERRAAVRRAANVLEDGAPPPGGHAVGLEHVHALLPDGAARRVPLRARDDALARRAEAVAAAARAVRAHLPRAPYWHRVRVAADGRLDPRLVARSEER